MNSNNDDINNTREEIQVFPFEKIQRIRVISNSIKSYEEKRGSRKRKSTTPKKIPRIECDDLFDDLSFNENDASRYIANEETYPTENEYNDSIDENFPNLFQFVKENNDEAFSSNNLPDKETFSNRTEAELALTTSEHTAHLSNNSLNKEIGVDDSQTDNDFEISAVFEKSIQKQIIDENWDFCKIAMTADISTISNFLSSSVLKDETSIMDETYTETLVNDTKINLTPKHSTHYTTLFEDDHVMNKECYVSPDQVLNNCMEVTEPLDMSFISRIETTPLIQKNNNEVMHVHSQEKLDDSASILNMINFEENVVSVVNNNFENLQMLSYDENGYANNIRDIELHSFASPAISTIRTSNRKNESDIKHSECESVETDIEMVTIDENCLDYIDISDDTSADKNTISKQIKTIDTREQSLVQSNCDTMLVSFNDRTSTMSPENMLAQQESPKCFTPEENFNLQNASKQITAENYKLPLLSSSKVQSKDKHSKSTKKKKSGLTKRSLEVERIILDLINEYVENTSKKDFTFHDVTDFITKNMPNTTYFKVLHTVRIFFVNNLKTGGFNPFGKV